MRASLCELVKAAEYDAILDEFNHIIVQGFVTKEEVLELIDALADTMRKLVMTGRNAPDWLMERPIW